MPDDTMKSISRRQSERITVLEKKVSALIDLIEAHNLVLNRMVFLIENMENNND